MCDHHHHHDHDHDHDHDAEDVSSSFSLYLKINLACVQCLNEEIEGSGQRVFKPWNERLDRTTYVQSDVDPELLFNIPFTGNVKLKSIALLGGEEETHPKTMKLYKNIANMTLDQTAKQADQEFALPRSYSDVLQLPTKAARFSNVNHISIYFPECFDSDRTKIYYIGMKGDFIPVRRQEVLITNYELSANPADHKHKLYDTPSHMIS